MIHPINIPDDLLAQNPSRPQFLDAKRPRIIYGQDGRRVNNHGQPLHPKSPGTQWNDFFMRSFVRRIALDRNDCREAEPNMVNTSDTKCLSSTLVSTPKCPNLIDIIDFQPKITAIASNDILIPVTQQQKSPVKQISKINDNKKILLESQSNSVNDDSDNDFDESLNASTRFGLSARLPLSRQISAKFEPLTLTPIIDPCCSPSEECELKNKFEEFARFDFAHSNFFSNNLDIPYCKVNGKLCKDSIKLFPNAVGSRIWTSLNENEKTNFAVMPSLELLFHIVSVIVHNNQMEMIMKMFNSSAKSVNFFITAHIHEAENDKIGLLLKKTFVQFNLHPKEETEKTMVFPITDYMTHMFRNYNKYPLIALHGRVSHQIN